MFNLSNDHPPGVQRWYTDVQAWIYMPASHRTGTPVQLPVLVFLHGRDQGLDGMDCNGQHRRSPENVLCHGPPKLLAQPHSAPTLLATKFAVITPQLPDRVSAWGGEQAVSRLARAIDGIKARGQPLFLIGWSKGGCGVFEIATEKPGRIRPNALISIDMAPMREPPECVVSRRVGPWLSEGKPAWLLYTDGHASIVSANELTIERFSLPKDDGADPSKMPNQLYSRPNAAQIEREKRHVWICENASRDPRVYEWFLSRQKT